MAGNNPYFVIYATKLKNSDATFFFNAFLNEDVINSMDPRDWWKNACTGELNAKFRDLFEKLFTFPASTGSIERSFSTLGSIMTKQRNRLSIEKAEKLCSVINYFKLKNSQKEGFSVRKKAL